MCRKEGSLKGHPLRGVQRSIRARLTSGSGRRPAHNLNSLAHFPLREPDRTEVARLSVIGCPW